MVIRSGRGNVSFTRAGRVRSQDASTPTGIFVTVTYTDPINVRGGPSTVLYPIIGQLNPGEVVPALGISPGREWIQISYRLRGDRLGIFLVCVHFRRRTSDRGTAANAHAACHLHH